MSVREGQRRLRDIAQNLEDNIPLSEVDKHFLIKALKRIAFGENAELTLDVQAKRGEQKGQADQQRKFHDQFIFSWIHAATMSEEDGGLGLTIKEAASLIKQNFPNLPTEETLIRQYSTVKKELGAYFQINRI